MIKNVLVHIGGIEVYGVVSILLFFAVFLGMLLWAFRMKRPHLESMGRLPLAEDAPPPVAMNRSSESVSVSDSVADSDPSHE